MFLSQQMWMHQDVIAHQTSQGKKTPSMAAQRRANIEYKVVKKPKGEFVLYGQNRTEIVESRQNSTSHNLNNPADEPLEILEGP